MTYRAAGVPLRAALPVASNNGVFHCIVTAAWEYRLWQRRYWEHTIRDDRDRERHVDYLHFNPVKHGLVGYVADWPYSSFHRFVRLGLLPRDWAGVSVAEAEGGFGEPAEPFADSILKRA